MPHGYQQYNSVPEQITAFKYTVVPDDASQQVITADQLRLALKVDADSMTDAEANEIILTAQAWAQNYAGIILFKSVVTTHRNEFFNSLGIELRRRPVLAGEPILVEYLSDAVLTTVASTIYFLAERNFYSILVLNHGECWPVNVDVQADAVKVTFTAGYGVDASSVPRDIIAGIKALAVYIATNPGDCDGCGDGSMAFPSTAAKLLGFHKPLKV